MHGEAVQEVKWRTLSFTHHLSVIFRGERHHIHLHAMGLTASVVGFGARAMLANKWLLFLYSVNTGGLESLCGLGWALQRPPHSGDCLQVDLLLKTSLKCKV